ncbi:MAG: transcription elongation factor GreA [Flavobacteriaceae bacterium]|jgi:transcription elongation factor GreA
MNEFSDKEYITKEQHQDLQVELNTLIKVKRREVLEALEHAKSLGDLKENAEYHQAREDQGKLEDRVREIEYILKNAEIVTRHKSTVVEVGSTLVIRKKGTRTDREFTLVGSGEADMAVGKLSYKSPLGLALMGHVKDDEIEFQTPTEKCFYKIISLS